MLKRCRARLEYLNLQKQKATNDIKAITEIINEITTSSLDEALLLIGTKDFQEFRSEMNI